MSKEEQFKREVEEAARVARDQFAHAMNNMPENGAQEDES